MFFPIQATPYVRLFKRLFFGQGSLQTISYKQDILCPEEKATLRSTVFLPGQIDRVKEYKATDHWGAPTKNSEIAAATSTTIIHPPTIAYHFKDAVLFDGAIYAGNFKHLVADKSLSQLGHARAISYKDVCTGFELPRYKILWPLACRRLHQLPTS